MPTHNRCCVYFTCLSMNLQAENLVINKKLLEGWGDEKENDENHVTFLHYVVFYFF